MRSKIGNTTVTVTYFSMVTSCMDQSTFLDRYFDQYPFKLHFWTVLVSRLKKKLTSLYWRQSDLCCLWLRSDKCPFWNLWKSFSVDLDAPALKESMNECTTKTHWLIPLVTNMVLFASNHIFCHTAQLQSKTFSSPKTGMSSTAFCRVSALTSPHSMWGQGILSNFTHTPLHICIVVSYKFSSASASIL